MSTQNATYDQAVSKARAIGAEHGEAAASWVFDGNTDPETYARVLEGLEDGDPEVLDSLPAPDLSGEWADGYTPRQLFEDTTGLDAHAEASWNADTYDALVMELCDAYEDAYSSAVHDEVARVAKYHVQKSDNSTLGRLLRAVRKHSGMTDEEVTEAGEHGADAGWPGFTYTVDCVSFYESNADDVWELLNETAESMGTCALAVAASFQRADIATDSQSFATLLAWFALEECGRWLGDA